MGNENIANVDRLHRLMDRENLQCVVARSGSNFTYLAGFDYAGTLARHLDFSDSPRGVLIVWPREGEPVLVLNRFAVDRARRDSWVQRIEVFDDYSESAWSKVATVLADLHLADARVGFEKTVISAASWEALTGHLPRAELIDSTAMMDEVRWVKTPAEIERIREGAALLDEAYIEIFSQVRDGDSEREIHARLIEACIRRGANWAHGILNSGRNTVVYGGESDFQFRRGDIIRNDYVLWYRGYPGHQSRTVCLGEPTDAQQRKYATIRDIYRSTVASAQPGVRACDVYCHAAQGFAEAGFPGRIGIAGHSVGTWWHQQAPYLVPADETPIEAGMVLAFEPHVDEYHIQDMFLIGESGQENLCPMMSTDGMFVIE
jgi:Xaa-Pro aminopeptidase